MERFAWKGRIRPGMQEEYKRRHDQIWPEMLALLKEAYHRPYSEAFTDDASVVEAMGKKITMVEGNRENIKITTPSDLRF